MAILDDNLTAFRNEINTVCAACGRDPACVRIVPATKTVAPDVINRLPALGLDTVGENRVQELIEKHGAVQGVKWHIIGQLQSNKVKYVIDKVEMIHSLDRRSLADEIERQCSRRGLIMPVLIEVNIARIDTHGGVAPEDVIDFAQTVITDYPHLSLRGLMAVLPPQGVEQACAEMRDLSNDLQRIAPDATELSMGMSADYAVAIRYGATIVRPGRILFGERNYGR